jgi:Sulfotransferase domain
MVDRVFIVGIQRCGTTFLYHLLDNHPQIVMAKPVRPEPKVFLSDSVTGDPSGYDALLFPDKPPEQMRGEKSTSYLDHEPALRRIAVTFPDAFYLVVLRDPVERALSHYRFSVDNGLETRSVEEAMLQDIEGREPAYDSKLSVSPFRYVRRGRYYEQLLTLARQVPYENTRVVLFEALLADPALVSGIYRFLRVDDHPNATVDPRETNTSVATIDVSTRVRQVLRDYYAPLNQALAGFLGRELDVWQ